MTVVGSSIGSRVSITFRLAHTSAELWPGLPGAAGAVPLAPFSLGVVEQHLAGVQALLGLASIAEIAAGRGANTAEILEYGRGMSVNTLSIASPMELVIAGSYLTTAAVDRLLRLAERFQKLRQQRAQTKIDQARAKTYEMLNVMVQEQLGRGPVSERVLTRMASVIDLANRLLLHTDELKVERPS